MAYAQPVTTDATICTPEELREAASKFLAEDPTTLEFDKAKGGVNNKVYRVKTADGKLFVLRVYNNGLNTPRVRYEHAVLTLLAGKKLGFEIPTLLPAVADGATFATLTSGAEACLFKAIPGGGAPLTAAKSIGKATAELLAAMADVKVEGLALPNPLYRNIYEAHHKMTRDLFFSTMASGAFDAVREPTDFLVAEVLKAEGLVARLLAMDPPLPEQQIHADLHFDNVLAEGDEVSGLLDFEFSAYDWRIMELAVGLSKYVSMKDIEPTLEAWVVGYKEGGGRLTAGEISVACDVIILRILSNVVYFAGRIAAGEDVPDCLTARVGTYTSRIKWIEERREWITGVLTKHLLETA